MSDFTPDEQMTLRVAMRKYMEDMRTNAITFASDPDTAEYFTRESTEAERLFEKLVQMDLRRIHAAREALAEAVMKDDPDYSEESWTESIKNAKERTTKRQYPRDDRPMHGPFLFIPNA